MVHFVNPAVKQPTTETEKSSGEDYQISVYRVQNSLLRLIFYQRSIKTLKDFWNSKTTHRSSMSCIQTKWIWLSRFNRFCKRLKSWKVWILKNWSNLTFLINSVTLLIYLKEIIFFVRTVADICVSFFRSMDFFQNQWFHCFLPLKRWFNEF